jgi:TonB-linked SusC/RagA family outer membrane protein
MQRWLMQLTGAPARQRWSHLGRVLIGVGVILSSAKAATAQEGAVAGVVVESKTLKPLAGAQVVVSGQGRGVLTDANGRFRITGISGTNITIEVVMIGYRAKQVQSNVGAIDVRVALDETAIELNEIVVTGTAGGTQKRALGNSLAKVRADEIVTIAPVKSMQDLLNGRAAGVVVMPGTGMVGSGSRVRIRGGLSTLSLSSDPLIYVDGIRVNNETGSGFVVQAFGSGVISRLNDFNPDEIESLEILKGPAAATLYGTEAARGVINIITKKGAPGGARFTFDLKQGANWFSNPEGRLYTNWAMVNGTPMSLNLVVSENERGTPIFRTGHVEGYSASVSGGSQETRYFVAADIDNEEGAERNNFRDRFSGRANLQLNPHPRFDLSTSVGYVKQDIGLSCEAGCGGAMWAAVFGGPHRTSAACTPTSAFGCGWSRGATSQSIETYYAWQDKQFIDRLTASVQFNYRPFSWLANRITVGTDITDEENTELGPYQTNDTIRFFLGANSANGFRTHSRRHQTFNTFDYSGTANFDVTAQLNSATSVGAQYYQRHIEFVSASGVEFAAPGLEVVSATARSVSGSEDYLDNNTLGLFGQQQFSWRDRLYLTGALRVDNNSAFGEEIQWVTYPKGMLSWVLNEEPFLRERLPVWLETFKLRVAYGQSGQQPASFAALRTYNPTPGPNNGAAVVPGSLGNPNLKPERGKEIELGFDAGLFTDRIGLEFTYYNQRTEDAILLKSVAPSSGFTGSQWVNVGEIANSGIEVSINSTPVRTGMLTWDLNLNMGTNKNEVRNLGGEAFIGGSRARSLVGYPVGSWFMPKVVSADRGPDTPTGAPTYTNLMCMGDAASNGAPVPCFTGTVLTAPRVYLGRGTPTNEGSLTSTVRLWQRLRVTAMIDWQRGHSKFNNNTRARCSSFNVCRENVFPKEYDDRLIAAYQRGLTIEGEFVEKADFAKLREVSVGYDIPDSQLRRFGARAASINFAARNLHTWTNYSGLDPENTFLSGTPGFLEQDNLPQLAQIITTFRIAF